MVVLVTNVLNEELQRFYMSINIDTIKVIAINNENPIINIQIDNKQIEQATSYEYLKVAIKNTKKLTKKKIVE